MSERLAECLAPVQELAATTAVPSVGYPSRFQYSMPPIISFTPNPRAASLKAPLVEALHPGP